MRISDWSSDVCSSDLFDVALADQVIEVDRAAPERPPHQHHWNRRHFPGLDQRQHLEQLVHRPIAAGKDDQPARAHEEVHLAHGEVVEAERKLRTDPGIGCLFAGKRDVEPDRACADLAGPRSEEHTSELQSLMRISYAVFCLKKTTTP